MADITIPIDNYINKTFKIKEESMIILPKKNNEVRKELNITFDLENSKDINSEVLNALSDGFVNGFIEGYKDIATNLLKYNYSYEEIKKITKLSYDSIKIIEDEIQNN